MNAPSTVARLALPQVPLLQVDGLTHYYGQRVGCRDVSFSVNHGEVLGIVGESGSGKSTVLAACAGRLPTAIGTVTYLDRTGTEQDVLILDDVARRRFERSEWGFVTQNPRDGLRLRVSAGANIAERVMESGVRNYGALREAASLWLDRVEITSDRMDDLPTQFSGGMQQRLQIARTLAPGPRLVFLDEPTGGLDVSVQAKLLDLLRRLVHELGLAAVIVTHDLGVARLLSDQLLVMQNGLVVESGLTDRVLDDPHHKYTQLLVSSVVSP
jgi:putative phosphonate transport system ATP-binding protein